MRSVSLGSIHWITRSASRLADWLINDCKGDTWTSENLRLTGIYRWTVSFITYESLFTEHWTEPWFQDGMKAFGLLALELEDKVTFLQSDSDDLYVRTPDGEVIGAKDFLAGESLAIRHDPEYSDLCWDPVDAVGHLLAEYEES